MSINELLALGFLNKKSQEKIKKKNKRNINHVVSVGVKILSRYTERWKKTSFVRI